VSRVTAAMRHPSAQSQPRSCTRTRSIIASHS
jgi:hypothetical protein